MHALLARDLIAACGGLDEAASASGRLKRSRLAEFQSVNSGAFMPADVMAALEAYCGKPIYSAAIAAALPSAAGEHLLAEVCAVSEDSALMQRLVRDLVATGRPMTPREKSVVAAGMLRLAQELREAQATVEGGEA
jgi:hypothetical protein